MVGVGSIITFLVSPVTKYVALAAAAFIAYQAWVDKTERNVLAGYVLEQVEWQRDATKKAKAIHKRAKRPGASERVRKKYCPKCKSNRKLLRKVQPDRDPAPRFPNR